MEHYELRLLAEYYCTGGQDANTWKRPTPRTVSGELERDERAEVIFAEIFPPVSAGLDGEELKKVIPVLDGQKYGEYISLSGELKSLMAPPKQSIWGGKLYSFGTPMSNNPLLSTTLKYSHNITVECLAGAAITGDYRVRLWGYVYQVDELSRVFGTMLFPAEIRDKGRDRVCPIVKGAIKVNGDTWKTLPGGNNQAIPKINPLARYAYNKVVTDAKSGDYQFRYTTGNVDESDENLYFDFDELDALLVEGLGIRAVTNLKETGLLIAGDYHPKGLIPTPYASAPGGADAFKPGLKGLNNLHFGEVSGIWACTSELGYLWYAIPKLERPYLIWNEKGMVVTRDDGTQIAANQIITALTGVRIEMHG